LIGAIAVEGQESGRAEPRSETFQLDATIVSLYVSHFCNDSTISCDVLPRIILSLAGLSRLPFLFKEVDLKLVWSAALIDSHQSRECLELLLSTKTFLSRVNVPGERLLDGENYGHVLTLNFSHKKSRV
jgi:hypothetical protein